jgi:cytochrome P450
MGPMSSPVSVHELDLPVLDLDTNPSREARERALAAAQAQHWLAKGVLGFAVTRYDDVVAILRDKRWYSAASLAIQLSGVTDPAFTAGRRQSILSMEGDDHTRLRRLVAPAFSPRSADRLRPYMRQVINDLVDAVVADGGCEFVSAICEPYPIPIICELLGAPKEDWRLFSRWAGDLLKIFNFDLREEYKLVMQASRELDEYSSQLIEARRSLPADDLLTELIAAEEAGDRLSHDELLGMVNAVIVGGTDTTRNQLACCVALLASHPDQWRSLAEHPELAPRAVEETMRYLGAIRGTARFASEDIVYRDVHFPKGTLLATVTSAANRDGSVWDDPGHFDITREPSGQPQLTFGSGIHYCLGASLARAELQEALPILARRMPNLALDGEITWKPDRVAIWGPERLPISFSASE